METQNTATYVIKWDEKNRRFYVLTDNSNKTTEYWSVVADFRFPTEVQVTLIQHPDGSLEARTSISHPKKDLIAICKKVVKEMAEAAAKDAERLDKVDPEPEPVTAENSPTPSETFIFMAFQHGIPKNWLMTGSGSRAECVNTNGPILVEHKVISSDDVCNFPKVEKCIKFVEDIHAK